MAMQLNIDFQEMDDIEVAWQQELHPQQVQPGLAGFSTGGGFLTLCQTCFCRSTTVISGLVISKFLIFCTTVIIWAFRNSRKSL